MANEDILKVVSMGKPLKKQKKKKEDEKDSTTLRILDMLQENVPEQKLAPEDEEEELKPRKRR